MNVTLTQPVAQFGDKGDTVDIADDIAAHWKAIGVAKNTPKAKTDTSKTSSDS